MNRKLLRLLTAVAPAALLLLAAGSAKADAINTTDAGCTAINVNLYDSREAVWINGSPSSINVSQNPGPFYVVVSAPGNTTLGVPPNVMGVKQATLLVNGDGSIPCQQLWTLVVKESDGSQGYDKTNNGGGEYKIDLYSDEALSNKVASDNWKIRETAPPAGPCPVSCPGDITVGNDDGQCSAALPDLQGPTVDSTCTVDHTISNDRPETFPVGTTLVTWSVVFHTTTDITVNCYQYVTVEDREDPSVTCPGNKTAQLDASTCQALVPDIRGEVEASDNCTAPGALTIEQSPAAGTPIELGTTTITVTVTDAAGNSSQCTTDVVAYSSIVAHKFYDTNTDGSQGTGENPIAGWTFYLKKGSDPAISGVTNDAGDAVFTGLAAGTYSVFELIGGKWQNTTSLSVDATVGCPQTFNFGNVCLGGGTGALTIGYWSNKTGSTYAASIASVLNCYKLRKPDGTVFTVTGGTTGATAFSNWILSANSTNSANMLSAQTAGMVCNVTKGLVDPNSIVYAPGTNLSPNGFTTIAALLAAAKAELATETSAGKLYVLGTNTTLAAKRAYEIALKDALDKANNNLNFVQSTPCAP